MKICNRCKLEKSITEFFKDSGCKDGVAARCKLCKSTQVKLWREKNIDHLKEYSKISYVRRSDKQKQWSKLKYHSDKSKAKLVSREYRKNNRPKIYARNAKRRAQQIGSIPLWANMSYINIFYQMAKDEKSRTSKDVEVDHIVPLQSKLVCGLHCEDNLQLLFKEDNIVKGNRTWPDMWEPL